MSGIRGWVAAAVAAAVLAGCGPAPMPTPTPAPAAPSARWDAAMAVDPGSGDLLLFGGTGARGEALTDTWLRPPAGGWRPVAGSVPVAGAMLAADPDAGGVVLTGHDLRGGFTPAQPVGLLTTWLWRGGAWHELQPPERPPGTLEPAGIAWSPRLHAVVLLGDDVHGLARRPQVWLWNGSDWFRPWQGVIGDDIGSVSDRLAVTPDGTVLVLNVSSRDPAGLVRVLRFTGPSGFVPAPAAGAAPPAVAATATWSGGVVALSASEIAPVTTWVLAPQGWRAAPGAPIPADRIGFALAPAGAGAYLFGGAASSDQTTVYADLWHWDGRAWSRAG